MKRVRKDSVDETRIQIAQLRADLHNIHYRSAKTDKVWTADMFMPGYEEAENKQVFDWRKDKAVMQQMANATRKMTPEERRQMAESSRIFHERQRRAEEARSAGHGSDVVRRIMEGLDG